MYVFCIFSLNNEPMSRSIREICKFMSEQTSSTGFSSLICQVSIAEMRTQELHKQELSLYHGCSWTWIEARWDKHVQLRIWHDMRIWGYEDMRIWGYEDMRIWGYEDMRIWGYEDMRIWGYLTAMKRSLAAVSCKVSQDVGNGGTDGAKRLPGDWKLFTEVIKVLNKSMRKRWKMGSGWWWSWEGDSKISMERLSLCWNSHRCLKAGKFSPEV